jgi:N-formylglutamate amidohydrolase
MKLIRGTQELPIIYTAHHASNDFGEFSPRVALTKEQRLRFSDYGSDLTVPTNGITAIVAERSRALGDLNRDPDDPGRFQDQDYGQPDRHNIWKPGKALTKQEKLLCQSTIYEPFHQAIIDQLRTRENLTFVVSWDNTAHYFIGDYVNGKNDMMRPFILSNRGLEDSPMAGPDEPTSCDPRFLAQLADNFTTALAQRGLPYEVLLNFVMRGGYITRRYSTLRNPEDFKKLGINCEVQSLQLEYDTSITHDQVTLKPKTENIKALKDAFSEAISKTVKGYLAKLV